MYVFCVIGTDWECCLPVLTNKIVITNIISKKSLEMSLKWYLFILYFRTKFLFILEIQYFRYFSILVSLATPTRKYSVWNSRVWVIFTGTCFIQKIYAPSSSLLQGKHLPFSPFRLRLNMFRLCVILSLTQLYFSFRLPHLNIPTGPPSDELDKNIQRMWLGKNFSHWNGYISVREYTYIWYTHTTYVIMHH